MSGFFKGPVLRATVTIPISPPVGVDDENTKHVKQKIVNNLEQMGNPIHTVRVRVLDVPNGMVELTGVCDMQAKDFQLTPSGPRFSDMEGCYAMPERGSMPRTREIKRLYDGTSSEKLDNYWYLQASIVRMVIEEIVPDIADKLWPMSAEERLKSRIELNVARQGRTGYWCFCVSELDTKKGEVTFTSHASDHYKLTKEGFFFSDRDADYVALKRSPNDPYTQFEFALKLRDAVAKSSPELDKALWSPQVPVVQPKEVKRPRRVRKLSPKVDTSENI